MRLLPRYRGLRMRPYMRYMKAILVFLIAMLGLIPIALYVYVLKDKLMEVDVFSISIVSSLVVVWLALSFYLGHILIEQTVFFAKWDRLQRLARFLFENRYYYEKKTKDKVSYRFPRIYIKQNKYDLEISFEMAGSKFQQKFKQIGGDLELTFAMDFMETEDDERFKIYRLAYSALLSRINVDEVTYDSENGVRLMKNFYWDFTSDPHLLVAGGTGGGKTVFLRSLVLCLSKIGIVEICDPKRADFVPLGKTAVLKDRVYIEREAMISAMERAAQRVSDRNDYMNQQMDEMGENDLRKFSEYGLDPYFLVIDEFNAFMSSLDGRQRERAEVALTNISLLGRQSGVYLIPAMQKPTLDDIPSKVRDNLSMRIVVGRLSSTGYDMMFGDVNRTKEFKFMKYIGGMRVYGRGYASIMGEVAREFFSPFLTKGFSFYDAFVQLERREDKIQPTVVKKTSEEVDDQGIPIQPFQKTLTEFAKEIGEDRRKLKRLCDMVHSLKDWDFSIDEKGQIVLAMEDERLLSSLIAEIDATDKTWKEIILAFEIETL